MLALAVLLPKKRYVAPAQHKVSTTVDMQISMYRDEIRAAGDDESGPIDSK
jgi:hypothetical protein